MTDSQEHLKIVAPGLLCVIYVHVGGEEAMAAAVAEVLAEDGANMADIARRHGVRRATLFESVKKLRGLCLKCCAEMGLDGRTMLAVRGEEDGASRGDAEAQEDEAGTRRRGE